jgi:predicted dehydrogenase
MKKAPIGLGVIGFGSMGKTIQVLRGVPGLRYELRAVCAQNADNLRQRAQQAGVPFWTTDYHELVQRKDVDVVVVFSPDHLHGQHSLAAIQAGKHVVCGKPNATNLEETRELIKLIRQKKVKYLAAYTLRQDQQYLAARKMLDDGDLGKLIAMESHYIHDMRDVYENTPWRLQVPQDMMFGGCMHAIDILRAFGGDVEWVQANANQGHLIPTYPIADNFFINMKFTSGVIGRVSGLYGVVHPPIPMNQIGLYCSKASLVCEYGPSQTRVVFDKFSGHQAFTTNYSPEPESSKYWYGPNMVRYMRHFQDCLDNDREPFPGIVESARSVAVGVAAWESIKTGQVVKVVNEF